MKGLHVGCREVRFDMSAKASEVELILLVRGSCEVVFTPIQRLVQQGPNGLRSRRGSAVRHNLVVFIQSGTFLRA